MKKSEIKLKILALLQDVDKVLAIFGIIFSFLFLIWGGVSSKIVAFLVGILLLISCSLWLTIRKSDLLKFHLQGSKSRVHFWAIGFFALYTLSILLIYLRSNLYERPLLFFILTALMAGSIACEILTAERRHIGVILIQILLLGVNISWTQLWITPGLVGIDPWYHSSLTSIIIERGFLPSGDLYAKLPFFHLMIASTSLFTTFSYKLATMVSVSFGQIACNAFFIFLITNYLFKNHRIGLLAALLLIIANLHILMSYWSIPNAFAAVFIPIILYLILIKIKGTPQLVVATVVILIMVAIIFTHTLVAICMALFLFVAWVASAIYRFFYSPIEDNISWIVPVGFTIGMFSWWAYNTSYLNTLSDFIALDFSFYSGTSPTSFGVIIPSTSEILFGFLGIYIFFIISIIGILYMISRKGDISTFSLALISVVPLCVSFIGYITQREILGYRWYYIAQILLSIPLAFALYSVGTWKIKKPIYLYLFFFGFIVSLSFLMLMSPYGNNDNHTFTPTIGEMESYTQTEIVGTDFFAKKSAGLLSSNGDISSRIFKYQYHLNTARLLVIDSQLKTGNFNHDGSIKIFSSVSISRSQKKGRFSSNIHPDLNTYISNSGFDKIYDNSVITGFTG